jgi:alpha 1,3-mannosyltransferase
MWTAGMRLTFGSVGDKETFWIGFELAGDSAYSWHQGDAGGMGVVVPLADSELESESTGNSTTSHKQNHTMCMPQLVHYDVKGKPLWFNGWLLDNKYADKR